MKRCNTRDGGLTIGLELGDRWIDGRVLDMSGETINSLGVRTTEPAMDCVVELVSRGARGPVYSAASSTPFGVDSLGSLSTRGPTLRSTISAIACVALMLIVPGAASARDTELFLPVSAAVSSELGQTRLFDVPYFLKGQAAPQVAKRLQQVDTSQSTRGAFRSDEESCNVAFLSALRVLQERAQLKGGNAIIDIVSSTRGKLTESATKFRCVAGSMVVHVGLKGTIVRLE